MARYFTIIQLTLVVAITYAGTFIFYRVVANQLETVPVFHGSAENSSSGAQTKTSDTRSQPLSHYKTTVDRDLFKTASKKPIKTGGDVDVNNLQQTQLGLKLWGTVHGVDGKTFAVIEEKKTRKQRLFSVGDQVESASVEMILREKVVLAVNGKREVLTIERPVQRAKGRIPRSIQPPSTDDARGVKGGDNKEVVIQRSRIEDAIKNVNQLMKHVRIRPHFTNGQPDGLRLTGVRPGTIFTEIGFRNGDIITGVNGKSIESVDDALKFYTSLKNESNVDLQLRRRGKERSIKYRVED